MDRDTRIAELEEKDWPEIKAIAESLNISKPDGTWKEAIPAIVDLEISMGIVHEVDASVTKDKDGIPVEHTVEISPIIPETESVQNVYDTGFYDLIGIKRCPDCGEKRRSDGWGNQICPESRDNCSFVRKSANQ